MFKTLMYLIVVMTILSCKEKEPADLIIHNANTLTVNKDFSSAEAFAIRDGKFIAVGTDKEILSQYNANDKLDVQGKTIVPGLIDGHCHFYGLGNYMQQVDLTGTKSFQEVLDRVADFQEEKKKDFILGRGWDQNDWSNQEFPTKKELDAMFPDTPVALDRIDGHAMLVNTAALELAGIDGSTEIEGGEIIKKNGKPTGVLIDKAMELVEDVVPEPSDLEKTKSLMDAQKVCLELGLTTVCDAGLDRDVIDLIDSLQKKGELKIKVYAMISANRDNLDHYLKTGPYKTDRLNVNSFKVYADGALGSRGALMKEAYADREDHFGSMVTPMDTMVSLAKTLAMSKFQMNTHAIGDSANAVVLRTYARELKSQTNRRWRIEHAQVIDTPEFAYFTEIIPSVQPTHATSDMYWAEDRIGSERIDGAYAFKTLLQVNGRVVLGTDFPVERVDPMLTFYAAVARKDLEGYPEGGFEPENGLSREETLKGMTIWPAYASFEENEKGSIEIGKMADFVILDQPLMEVPIEEVPNIKILGTYINGEKVY